MSEEHLVFTAEADDALARRVGQRIKAVRKLRRFKQAELAELIDRSVETVSTIERGKAAPGLITLARLARVLDVPPNDLFDGAHDATVLPFRAGLMTGITERLRGLDDRSLRLAHHVVGGLVAADAGGRKTR